MRLDTVAPVMLMDWTGAACAGIDVNTFFPTVGENVKAKQAIAICSSCPIRHRCLEYAMGFSSRDLPGIWGATTERHRDRLRRTRVLNQQKEATPI